MSTFCSTIRTLWYWSVHQSHGSHFVPLQLLACIMRISGLHENFELLQSVGYTGFRSAIWQSHCICAGLSHPLSRSVTTLHFLCSMRQNLQMHQNFQCPNSTTGWCENDHKQCKHYIQSCACACIHWARSQPPGHCDCYVEAIWQSKIGFLHQLIDSAQYSFNLRPILCIRALCQVLLQHLCAVCIPLHWEQAQASIPYIFSKVSRGPVLMSQPQSV